MRRISRSWVGFFLVAAGSAPLYVIACGGTDGEPIQPGGPDGGQSPDVSSGGGPEDDAGDRDAAADTARPDRTEPSVVLAAGGHSICALGSRRVKCWGSNAFGQLGIGAADNARHVVPNEPIAELVEATGVDLSQQHGCAIAFGSVQCWGDNLYGQLGHDPAREYDAGDAGLCGAGIPPCSPAPSAVAATTGANGIGAGDTFTCMRRGTGVWCWGKGDKGEIGPADASIVTSPNPVPIGDVAELAVGGAFACARKFGDGSVWCWGRNLRGEVGREDGAPIAVPLWDDAPHPTPRRVGNLTNVRAIAAGVQHACAILEDETVACWGSNASGVATSSGQLGHTGDDVACINGEPCNPAPRIVAGLTGVRELALGRNHSCAVLADDSVRCWGLRDFLSPSSGSPTPEAVSGLSDVAHVVAGVYFTCAIRWDSQVYCWGVDIWGAMGLPNSVASYTPVKVEGIE